MKDVIFREYDIRGKVGTEFVLDQVYDLTSAIAFYFLQQHSQAKTIVVGMDGRTHSPAIKQAVCAALCDSGLDVLFVGICPSPTVYFSQHTLSVDGAFIITASHNPKEYNGLKLCLQKEMVWGKQLQEIKNLYKQRKKNNASVRGLYKEHPIVGEYIEYLSTHFAHLKNIPLSLVIDCGNGATGAIIPQLVEKMEWRNVKILYPEIDGEYPHHEADPVVESNMSDVKNLLLSQSFDFGIGFDGDGDRMAPMTKQGYLVPGDKVLALFAKQVVQHHKKVAVVFDIKSSSGLVELLEQLGATPCISPSGHALIKREMKKHNAILGGELSCHFFFHDRYFGFDDGMYAFLRLCEIIVQSKKSLDELLTIFPHKISSQEYRIACTDEKKHTIIEAIKNNFMQRKDVQVITIDGVRASMQYGWGLIRSSNTQPVLCLRFESNTLEGLQQVKQEFISLLHSHLDASSLRELY